MTTNENTSNSIDMSIIEYIKKEKESNNLKIETESNQAMVSQKDGVDLIEKLSKSREISFHDAFSGVAIICQKGGTSKKAQGNIYAIVNGKRILLSEVRDIISQNKMKFTLRQWARTFATEIHGVSEIFSIPGDLTKIIARKHPNITNEDAIWLSNFQMDNPNAPDEMKALIMEHFQELFPGNKK